MNKNILITGGAGYIGSQISHDLKKLGFKVFIIDNLSTGNKSLLPKNSKFYKKEIKETNFIKNLILKKKINTIMHLAASLSVEESSSYPLKYFDNNVTGTISLMEAASKSGIKNIIFSSTSAVYGNTKEKKIKENHPKNPISNYARTKLICENIIKYYCYNFNINSAILRYFNVAGADPTNKIGCLNEIGQLFKNLSKNIAKKNYTVQIFGNKYLTKDGTCIRDYIHVKDISLIHINSLNYISSNNRSIELNCGYGKGYSVLDIIKSFEKVHKIKMKKIIKPKRKGDTTISVCENSYLKKILNFKPKYNSLSKIVEDSLDWELFILNKKNNRNF